MKSAGGGGGKGGQQMPMPAGGPTMQAAPTAPMPGADGAAAAPTPQQAQNLQSMLGKVKGMMPPPQGGAGACTRRR